MAFTDLPYDSYTPHPSIPGAYNFSNGGGNPILAGGDEAERLRRLIDASPKPQLTADNSGIANLPPGAQLGQDPSLAGAIQDMHASDVRAPVPGMQLAHTSAPAAPKPTAAGMMNVEMPQSAGARSAEATAAQQVPVRQITPAKPAAGAAAQQPGAVPPPNLADLDSMLQVTHTKAGYTPTSRKVVTEGGVQDPELQKLMAEGYGHKMAADAAAAKAQELLLQRQVQAGQMEAAAAAKEADELHQKQVANLAAQQEASKEYNRVMAQKQDELANESKREVDQFRLFRGKPGAQIGAAIAAGLGAFGASLSHTPNFALDIINKSIDNDVQAQRDEINRGVASKQNDIARIRDKYGVDTNIAEKLLTVSLNERAQALARKQAALQGTAEAQQKLAGLDQALANQNLATLKSIQDDMYGKAQVTAEEKYRQGGTSYTLSPLAVARDKAAGLAAHTAESAGKIAAGEHAALNEGRTAAQSDKAAATGAQGEKQLIPQMARANVANQAALDALDRLEAEVNKGTLHRVGQKITGLGADTDMQAEATHAAQAIASAEVKGMQPDQKRAADIEHDLSSMNKQQQLTHIHALRQTLLEQKKSILNTSANTARVGQVGGGTESGSAEE